MNMADVIRIALSALKIAAAVYIGLCILLFFRQSRMVYFPLAKVLATPADAALCMQLGVDGVFVGSGIFKSADPKSRAKAIVEATCHFNDAKIIAKASEGIGEAMKGLEIAKLEVRMQERGW